MFQLQIILSIVTIKHPKENIIIPAIGSINNGNNTKGSNTIKPHAQSFLANIGYKKYCAIGIHASHAFLYFSFFAI